MTYDGLGDDAASKEVPLLVFLLQTAANQPILDGSWRDNHEYCGLVVGKGETEWDNVHIDDLADLFVKLLDATQDAGKNANPEIFGLHGYFLASNGVHRWSDVSRWILDEAAKQGYLSGATTKTVSLQEAEKFGGVAAPSFARNSKGIPQRAEKYLGWKPKGADLRSTIGTIVAEEAKALGLEKK
ncbi:hypothetical protein NLG97_g7593 [Lecanicillium saksenae]|uniref:Uncharacterized protein n=1 Tax=Lecanicillium saksenae TaxID=468837 RepID=A0ACC1QLE7_9HYPO|nr:hypothetical protein NLG97_g7593 [Lecanicillium saksenae]